MFPGRIADRLLTPLQCLMAHEFTRWFIFN